MLWAALVLGILLEGFPHARRAERLVVLAARGLLVCLIELPLEIGQPTLEVQEIPGAEPIELAKDEGFVVRTYGDTVGQRPKTSPLRRILSVHFVTVPLTSGVETSVTTAVACGHRLMRFSCVELAGRRIRVGSNQHFFRICGWLVTVIQSGHPDAFRCWAFGAVLPKLFSLPGFFLLGCALSHVATTDVFQK